MNIEKIKTIRYMGNKNKLLNFIIPEIIKITPKSGTVVDLMAGANSISYGLKKNFRIITNDVQYYSFIISKALIENQYVFINENLALNDLEKYFKLNQEKNFFNFFQKNYSDTYFSNKQCQEIDSLRYSIEQINSLYKKNLYLLSLMGAMCKVQSTPGHFAQFMPKEHKRIKILRNMSLKKEFYKRTNHYSNFIISNFKNQSFCYDYKVLINEKIIKNVDTIYVDTPYNQEQYSRFYHILETICKYDNPKLYFKAKYRDDRFKSNFCYKKKVFNEFTYILDYACNNNINLALSYSNKGIINIDDIANYAETLFKNVSLKKKDYSHSSQGKGNKSIIEYLLICSI